MKYLIIGRTGSGKTYFANLLENFGLKPVVSRATRKRRDGEDKCDYIWLTKAEADEQQDRVAQTKINGHQYFTLADDLKGKDLYIIDPNGMYDLLKHTPDIDYHIIYIKAKCKDRKKHAVSRVKNHAEAEKEFVKRDQSEDEQFTKFEKLINNMDKNIYDELPENIEAVHIIDNDFTPKSHLQDWADRIENDFHLINRLSKLVVKAGDLNILRKMPDNRYQAKMKDTKNKQETIRNLTADSYAENLLRNAQSFVSFMVSLLLADQEIDNWKK